MDKKEQQERILKLLNECAMEVIRHPPEQREGAILRFKEGSLKSAKQAFGKEATASEWADQMDEWLRALVRIIENSGGGKGGTA